MKKFLGLIFLVAAISCNNAKTSDSVTEKSSVTTDNPGEESKAVVNKFMEAELRGDTTAMSALLTDDYIQYGLGVNDSADKAKTLNGVQHHWEVYKYGGKRFKAIQTIATTTTEDGGRGRGKGDWVFQWGDMSTDYPATPDYGNKATTAVFAYHAVYRVKDGKINTRTIYFNHEDIMRQLGYKMVSVAEQQKPGAAELKYK